MYSFLQSSAKLITYLNEFPHHVLSYIENLSGTSHSCTCLHITHACICESCGVEHSYIIVVLSRCDSTYTPNMAHD